MNESTGLTVVLRRQTAGKVERGACNVRVDIDSAGKHHHAAGIDGARGALVRQLVDNFAVLQAHVLYNTVDPVFRVVNLPAGNP
jgi:hypothetical protein